MTDSWEKLYRKQCEEYEATNSRLRDAEKQCANLRGELFAVKRERDNSISMLQGIAANINKAYAKD
jgi:hypothetical protein